MSIPIIDLFAGPGGLGEGFSSLTDDKSDRVFKIGLSIEKDRFAHMTLLLRSFVRQFPKNDIPPDYYEFLQRKISQEELFERYPDAAESAKKEAWNANITPEISDEIDDRIRSVIGENDNWLLIGGPPCQAYSLAGRSRNRGIDPDDPRVYLYREYYRILAAHNPPVFIMENVKGLLSAEVENSSIFQQILSDLRNPVAAYEALRGSNNRSWKCPGYKIYSLVNKPDSFELDSRPVYNSHGKYVIKAEEFGIPQARHRVILLGIRNDIGDINPDILEPQKMVSVSDAISNLPELRSGLSKQKDNNQNWRDQFVKLWDNGLLDAFDKDVYLCIKTALIQLVSSTHNRGGEYIPHGVSNMSFRPDWFIDENISGVCNHSTRGHIVKDLYRYLFVSCYGEIHEISPKLKDFPEVLLPEHKNVTEAVSLNKFADRFRVQLKDEPAKTITSHISKDGHYFIHYDPTQCRSLTVREAARLQTFPDNYFFCGPRTAQYVQVGNAVPPLLANKIAKIVFDLFKKKKYMFPLDKSNIVHSHTDVF